MPEETIMDLLNKPTDKRTAADVMRLRTEGAVYGGCCDRFADNKQCDCLLRAPDSPLRNRSQTQMNDTVTDFLKAELERVQTERDTAQANERQQMRVVAELRQQVGLLLGAIEMAATAANNEEYLQEDGLNNIIEKVAESEARIAEVNKTRAVV